MPIGPTIFAHYKNDDGSYHIGLSNWLVTRPDGAPMIGAHVWTEEEATDFFDQCEADLSRQRKATIAEMRRSKRCP